MNLERLAALALLGMTVALSGNPDEMSLEIEEGSAYYVRGCQCGVERDQRIIRHHNQNSGKKNIPSIG